MQKIYIEHLCIFILWFYHTVHLGKELNYEWKKINENEVEKFIHTYLCTTSWKDRQKRKEHHEKA